MPDTGVDIRIRTRGARQAATEAKLVGREIGAIDSSARRGAGGLRLFSRASVSAGRGLHVAAGAAAYGAAAIGGLLLVELKRSTEAWQETRKVTAQTGAVLRSTGAAAHVTAREVGALADALSRKTGIDDETIQSGENMLLTFTRIRNEAGRGNDIFTQATRTMLDMSAALGQDTKNSAIQLGKALNDPVKGVTALHRVGVTFTKGQVDQIKALEESGQHLQAQRLILRELNKEFGGSAAAQATPLDRLKVSFGNLEEAIGHGVQPLTDRLFTRLDRGISHATPQIDALGQRLDKIAASKNLTTAQKFDLGFADVKRTLRPFEHQLRREIGAMRLGDKLGAAFDRAAPAIGDAAARAAPKAARAFLNAWLHMGLGGKLFTAALFASRLGIFSDLARLAWRRFLKGWGAGALPCIPCAEPKIPRKVPPTVPGPLTRGGRFARLGRTATELARRAPELAVPALIYEGIHHYHGPKRSLRDAQRHTRPDRGALGADLALGPRITQNTIRLPGSHRAIDISDARRLANYPDSHVRVRTRAPRARTSGAVIHTHVHLNGREVARAVNRVNADAGSRDQPPPGTFGR